MLKNRSDFFRQVAPATWGEWEHGSWGLTLRVTRMLNKNRSDFFRQVAPATWGEWEHGSWGVIEKNRSDFFGKSPLQPRENGIQAKPTQASEATS